MSELDGNAAGGLLHDVFGIDVTAAETVCVSCGATRVVAELVVYLDGPGTVVRCRSCKGLLMAVVTIRGRSCVDLRGLRGFEPGTWA